jgi:hypothetical protein
VVAMAHKIMYRCALDNLGVKKVLAPSKYPLNEMAHKVICHEKQNNLPHFQISEYRYRTLIVNILPAFLRRSSRNKRTSFTHLNDSDIEIVSPPQMVPYRRAGTAAAAAAAAVTAVAATAAAATAVAVDAATSAVEPVVPNIRKAGGVSPLVGGPAAAHRKRLNRLGLRNVSYQILIKGTESLNF